MTVVCKEVWTFIETCGQRHMWEHTSHGWKRPFPPGHWNICPVSKHLVWFCSI